MVAEGSLSASANNMNFAVDLNFDWTNGPNGRYVPMVRVPDQGTAVILDDADLSISITGDVFASIISFIEPLFHGLVKQ